jgi:hypothetical protein
MRLEVPCFSKGMQAWQSPGRDARDTGKQYMCNWLVLAVADPSSARMEVMPGLLHTAASGAVHSHSSRYGFSASSGNDSTPLGKAVLMS